MIIGAFGSISSPCLIHLGPGTGFLGKHSPNVDESLARFLS